MYSSEKYMCRGHQSGVKKAITFKLWPHTNHSRKQDSGGSAPLTRRPL